MTAAALDGLPDRAATPSWAGCRNEVPGTVHGTVLQVGSAGNVNVSLPSQSVLPAQLPADTKYFTGRSLELDALLSSRLETSATAPGILAIEGMAGIGKTALAVHAAHQMAGRFPGGVLFIDLRGFAPRANPMSPEDALAILLRGLGVPGDRIPPGTDARAGLYRSELARRQTLVVLDNAFDEQQVRPLLPGSANCVVIVTSRRQLAGLDDAEHITLPCLDSTDAVALFTEIAGDRVAETTGIVEEIVALCGHLPLAVRIAAARLRVSPILGPAELLQELRSEKERGRRLACLDDLDRNIASAFAVSYRHLPATHQAAFRHLSLHPGPEIEVLSAAALLRSDVEETRRILGDLVAVNLISQRGHDRVAFPDLTRAYATEVAEATDSATERHSAMTRLLDYFAQTVALAMRLVDPFVDLRIPAMSIPPIAISDIVDMKQAMTWLDAYLPELLAVASIAAHNGWPGHAQIFMATVAYLHMSSRGRPAQAIALQTEVLRVARTVSDRPGEADTLATLCHTFWARGQFETARDCSQRALDVARRAHYRAGELAALVGLGYTHSELGFYERAQTYFQQALTISVEIGERAGTFDSLLNLAQIAREFGDDETADLNYSRIISMVGGSRDTLGPVLIGHAHRGLGPHEIARGYFNQAIRIAQGYGLRSREVAALIGLGCVNADQHRYDSAEDYFKRAVIMAEDTGLRIRELAALSGVGRVCRVQGKYELARAHYRKLLTVAGDTGHRRYQLDALLGLGQIQRATGDLKPTIRNHRQALAIAGDLGLPMYAARAHYEIAHAYRELGQPDQASRHWRHTYDILTGLRIERVLDEEEVDIANVRRHLAGLGGGSTD